MTPECADALDLLANCQKPFLIGVRHHSAALARVMPELLQQISPTSILLEMPPDFASWIPHLGSDDLKAPVALAACNDARLMSFYPMADFSPELAAIRWAFANKVPVIPCDLDLQSMSAVEGKLSPARDEDEGNKSDEGDLQSREMMPMLLKKSRSSDTGQLWDALVETPATGSSPESIRRAALLFGWIIRQDSAGPSIRDAHRELAMRMAIEKAPSLSLIHI